MSMRAVLDREPEKDPEAAIVETIARYDADPLAASLASRRLGNYRGYVELLRRIQSFVERGAELVRFGRSVEGDSLFALSFGAPRTDRLTRTSVVLSGVHPSEWIGIETHLALLERLVGADLADRRIISVPILNPDGLRRVERNLRSGKRWFVRHNARGVDLNRNFDSSWGRMSFGQRILGRVFNPGSRAASEPEIEALTYLLSSVRIDRAVSLHSFGGAVLHPRAASKRKIHDIVEHQEWAQRIAVAIDPRRPYRAISCADFSKGFTAGGLELDWFHDRHGAVSLLIECSRREGLHPSRLFEPFAWFNPRDIRGVSSAIADALIPYVRGLPP